MKEKHQLDEGMYILNAALSEDARKKAIDRISSSITEGGGEIHRVHDEGRKKLAYEIRGAREGYYYVPYLSAPTNKLEELWKEYHLNQDLLRFMTLQAEEVRETLAFKTLPE